MSEILIRGMDKPGGCRECDFCEVQDINFETLYFCNRNDRFLDDEEVCNIPSDCPIIELPPHGDLIDRDKCIDYIRNNDVHAWEALAYEDVIVPANKEEGE